MTVGLRPNFTRLVRQRWKSILANIRERLLTNAWCVHCRLEAARSFPTDAIEETFPGPTLGRFQP